MSTSDEIKEIGKKLVVGTKPVDPFADTDNVDVQDDLEVSVEASEGDVSDMEDLDAIIDGHKSPVSGGQPTDSIDALLLSEYCEEVKRPCLPPVSTKLAEIVTTWLCSAPKKEKIKELFKDALVPENVEGLMPVRINELLYQKLPASYKHANLHLRGQNTFFTRGLGPLISLLDQFLKAQVALRSCGKNDISKEGDSIKLKEVTIDLAQMRGLLDTAVKLLCVGNGSTLQRRKHQLRSFLVPHYHYLLKPTNKVTSELLGPDIDQRITESNKMYEATKKLQVRRPNTPYNNQWRGAYRGHPARGRGWTQGRGCPSHDRGVGRRRPGPYPNNYGQNQKRAREQTTRGHGANRYLRKK